MIINALMPSNLMSYIILTLAVPAFLLAHKLGSTKQTITKVLLSLGLLSLLSIVQIGPNA